MRRRNTLARLEQIEAARVARWWQLCEELHGYVVAQLTDTELLDYARAVDCVDVPDWWPAAVDRIVGNDPRWMEACNLEQSLLAVGYQIVVQDGVIVAPGMVKR